jgi:hypothetical protein
MDDKTLIFILIKHAKSILTFFLIICNHFTILTKLVAFIGSNEKMKNYH